MKKLSDQEIIRRNKLEKLKNLGINPYPSKLYKINININNIYKKYIDNYWVSIAGRIMRIRIIGKSSFIELKDHTGIIQLYINQKYILNDEKKIIYNEIFKKLIDIGDIIGICGNLFKTKKGEITVRITNFKLLCKSLRPLPQVKIDQEGNIYDNFSDKEKKYRMRYIDLIVNDSTKKVFLIRSKTIQYIRELLNNDEYLEVETPILQIIPGGAIAKPFITHHNTMNTLLYLRISNELYLKRLIVGGFNGVYEFSKDFRNEGMDRIHNPEFTILELYVAYKDYYWMMDFTENLIKKICLKIKGTTRFIVNNKYINFDTPYKRITIFNSIKKYTGFDLSKMNKNEIRDVCIKLNINYEMNYNKEKLIDYIFSEKCEKNYIQPTFITDYPINMSPLSKKHRDNNDLSERFELIINGEEICNAYSELNDPIDQYNRFKNQINNSLDKKNNDSMFIDYDFLRALEFGMPPTAGIGIGIDRLIMILTNQKSIQDVILFPQMKLEKKY